MAFHATPLFAGDLYDTSERLAASPEGAAPRAAGSAQSSAKWRQMLDLGWQGVLVAEDHGGVGGSLADLAAIVEGAAAHALVVPLIDRCAVAPVLLSAAAAQAAVRPLLEAISVGDASVCPVLDTGRNLPGPMGTVRLSATGQLRGTLKGADLTEPATHLVVNTWQDGEGQGALVLLPTASLLASARFYRGLDGRVTADIPLDGVQLESEQIVLRGAAVSQALGAALRAGSLMTCVQGVGAAGAMIAQTIDYLNTRVQFGVQLATFQALRHRVVEMYVAYENASGLVRQQVEQGGAGAGYSRDVALAKLYVAGVSRSLSEAAIQLHGGMGMTWEMLAARLAMHAMQGSQQFGDRSQCLDWLAAQTAAEAQPA